MSPDNFTPTPASVPTSLTAPTYMPPSADESIARSGAWLPSAARAVAFKVRASTSLRPATMVSFFAWICAVMVAARVMISN